MRGHEQIITVRRHGMKPGAVFVNVSAPLSTHMEFDGTRVDIPASEPIGRQDFRWAIGLTVHVSGADEGRVIAASRAIAEFGAAHVFSSLVEPLGEEFRAVWLRKEAANG